MHEIAWFWGCREEAPDLESVKLLVDAGWFLDIPPYATRSDGMTFEKCAKALAASYGAVYDGCALGALPAGPQGPFNPQCPFAGFDHFRCRGGCNLILCLPELCTLACLDLLMV